MILSIGEILADLIGKTASGETTFSRFPGGAPFNVMLMVRFREILHRIHKSYRQIKRLDTSWPKKPK